MERRTKDWAFIFCWKSPLSHHLAYRVMLLTDKQKKHCENITSLVGVTDSFSSLIRFFLILVMIIYASFISQESTKITLAPSNADVHVGENTWVECAASYDPLVDITFIWSLNGQEIDLQKDHTHYESTLVSDHHKDLGSF